MIEYDCFKLNKQHPLGNPMGIFWKSISYPGGLGEMIVSVIRNFLWIVFHIRDPIVVALVGLSVMTKMFIICPVQYGSHIFKKLIYHCSLQYFFV